MSPARASGVSSGARSRSWRHSRSTSGSARGQQRLDRLAPAGFHDIVGVLPRGERDEAQRALGAEVGEGALGGADRGLLPGIVAVEAQDRRGLEPPHPLELRLGQRGAVGRDRLGDPGAVERDDVHIAFDHDQPVGLARRGPGAVDIVERAPLVEQDRLGRIEIFGLAVAEDAPAKGDDAPALVADREHQPAAEAVVGLLIGLLGADQHAGVDELVLALRGERGLQPVAAVGREAEPEAGDGGGVDAALGEVAARLGALAAGKLLGVIISALTP